MSTRASAGVRTTFVEAWGASGCVRDALNERIQPAEAATVGVEQRHRVTDGEERPDQVLGFGEGERGLEVVVRPEFVVGRCTEDRSQYMGFDLADPVVEPMVQDGIQQFPGTCRASTSMFDSCSSKVEVGAPPQNSCCLLDDPLGLIEFVDGHEYSGGEWNDRHGPGTHPRVGQSGQHPVGDVASS